MVTFDTGFKEIVTSFRNNVSSFPLFYEV